MPWKNGTANTPGQTRVRAVASKLHLITFIGEVDLHQARVTASYFIQLHLTMLTKRTSLPSKPGKRRVIAESYISNYSHIENVTLIKARVTVSHGRKLHQDTLMKRMALQFSLEQRSNFAVRQSAGSNNNSHNEIVNEYR